MKFRLACALSSTVRRCPALSVVRQYYVQVLGTILICRVGVAVVLDTLETLPSKLLPLEVCSCFTRSMAVGEETDRRV